MTTKYCLYVIMLAAAMAPFLGAGAEEEVTLEGEPVDIQCYLGGQRGAGHAACARSCAEKGLPIGFVTKGNDGKEQMYLVMGGNHKSAKDYMAKHMGKTVQAKGKVVEKDGLKILTVSKVITGESKSKN